MEACWCMFANQMLQGVTKDASHVAHLAKMGSQTRE